MVPETSELVALVQLVERLPLLPRAPRGRGHPPVYSDRLFLKALVIRIVRRLTTVHTLLAVLDQPTPEMRQLRAWLTEQGAIRRGAPGSAGCAGCLTRCPGKSAAWGGTW